MSYKVNNTIFVREETIDDLPVYFLYVGDLNEMYKLNQAAYDCFSFFRSGLNTAEVCNALAAKYSSSSSEQIRSDVEEIIKDFVSNGIMEAV